jgi:hypothetical protein
VRLCRASVELATQRQRGSVKAAHAVDAAARGGGAGAEVESAQGRCMRVVIVVIHRPATLAAAGEIFELRRGRLD